MSVFGATTGKMVYLGQRNSEVGAVLETPADVSHRRSPVTVPQCTIPPVCAAPGCSKLKGKKSKYCTTHRKRLEKRGCFDIAHQTATSLSGEIWQPAPGYEGIYEVSNFGRVQSLRRNWLLNQTTETYPRVSLGRDGQERMVRVHLLVAAAFLGPCPDGKEVHHKDFDTTNARADNLEYLTHSENIVLSVEAGRFNPNQKLTVEDVRAIRASHETEHVIAERYGIATSTAYKVKARKTWKFVK